MALKIIDSARKHGVLDDDIIYMLPDGTPLTGEVVDKLVAGVYNALDNGAYRSIANPHGKPQPRKITNSKLRAQLQRIVAAE
jgi:hypothetical protein